MNFGDSALESENKELKRQLFQKDANISSVQNELFKLKEELVDVKRSKDDALYQLGAEAEKLVKSDEQLVKTSTELKSYKLRLANADSALAVAQREATSNLKSAKQDQYRSEVFGLQGQQEVDKLRVEKGKLEEKIKGLERDLKEAKAAASASASASAAAAGGGGGPVRISGLPLPSSRLPQSKTRRRSSSTSTFSTSSYSAPPPTTVDPSELLKSKLSKLTSDLLQAENAKLLLERQLKRERLEAEERLDEVKEDVERVQWELKGITKEKEELETQVGRLKAGGDVNEEGEREREELKVKISGLEERIRTLEGEVKSKDGELKNLSTSTAEQVAQLQNQISSAKSDHSKLLSQITTLEEALTTEQSTSSSVQTNLASQLVSLQTKLSTAQQTLTERASYVNSLESQLTEEKNRVLEKETVAFGEETEKKDALDRVRQLEEDLVAVANWQDQKSDLESRVESLNTQIVDLEASLAQSQILVGQTQTAANELRDQLEASQSACFEAEEEISRLESSLHERMSVEEAEEKEAELTRVKLEVSELTRKVEVLECDLEKTEESHRVEVEGFESSNASSMAALEEVRQALSAKEKEVSKLQLKLSTKEEEIRELTRALHATPPPAPAIELPSVEPSPVKNATRDLDGGIRLSKEEAEGVERMEGAIARLRAERNTLLLEKEELSRSIDFSEAETRIAREEISTLNQTVAEQLAEHTTLRAISEDTFTLAESLQTQLDLAKPAIAELEALRDELVQNLDTSNSQLAILRKSEETTQQTIESLKLELEEVKSKMDETDTLLKDALEAKEAAERDVALKDSAVAQAVLEKDSIEKELDIKTREFADREVLVKDAQAENAPPTVAAENVVPSEAASKDIQDGASSADMDELFKEKTALEARLQRRNVSIEKQQHELAKLTTSYALLKDSFDDLEEEFEEMKAEKETLMSDIAKHLSTHDKLSADLEDARSSVQRFETVTSVAAVPPDYNEEQVAALVEALFVERSRHQLSTASSEDTGMHDLLAETAARLEATVDQLSDARERSKALEAQLAREDGQLHLLLDSATSRLEAIEAELSRTIIRSEENKFALQLANSTLADRLDATTANLNARAMEVLTSRSSMRVLLADLEASTARLDAREQTDDHAAAVSEVKLEVSRLQSVVEDLTASLADKEASLSSDEERSRFEEVKVALEQQVLSLRIELDDVRSARDLVEQDQVQLCEQIATLQTSLSSATEGERSLTDLSDSDELAQVRSLHLETEAKHAAMLELLHEAEEAISTLQSQLDASQTALVDLRSTENDKASSDATHDIPSRLEETETAHRALIANHEETMNSLIASRQAEVTLQEEAASRRAQLDDVLEGLSKLQQDHASLTHAKSIAEGQVAQILASREDALQQLQTEHAKALQTAEIARRVKAEEASDLQMELRAAKASLSEAISRSEAQDSQIESHAENVSRLQADVSAAQEAVKASGARLATAEGLVVVHQSDKDAALAELDTLKAAVAHHTTALQDRERLHLETTQKIDSLQNHIARVEEKLDAAEQRLGRQKARHDDEMAALEDSLAKASATSGAPVDEGSAEQKIADLEDHVERLIASLDQKNVEVEEADDKIISMLKEKKKSERKIELLQKKLNKATSAAAVAPPPVAIPPQAPVTRAPASPLNPSAPVFVSNSPVRVTPAPAATSTAAATPKVVNMFATPAVAHSRTPPASLSSSHGFTPVSHRPIASSRRVSGDHATPSGPGTPRSRIASAPVVPSPRATPQQSIFAIDSLPPPPSSLGTKRSRPAELEQIGPSSVAAVCAPAPSPAALSSILAPASGNTPRRAPLFTRKAEQKGFTPKRSEAALARAALLEKRGPVDVGAVPSTRLGSMTQGSTGGLKASTGDLMSRLAAMRR